MSVKYATAAGKMLKCDTVIMYRVNTIVMMGGEQWKCGNTHTTQILLPLPYRRESTTSTEQCRTTTSGPGRTIIIILEPDGIIHINTCIMYSLGQYIADSVDECSTKYHRYIYNNTYQPSNNALYGIACRFNFVNTL